VSVECLHARYALILILLILESGDEREALDVKFTHVSKNASRLLAVVLPFLLAIILVL